MSDQHKKTFMSSSDFFDIKSEDSAQDVNGEQVGAQDDMQQQDTNDSQKPASPPKSKPSKKADFKKAPRRGRPRKKNKAWSRKDDQQIGIIGGPGCGKTAYLYTLGLLRQKKGIIVGGWEIGGFSTKYGEFFSKIDNEEYLKNWVGTPHDILTIFNMFPLTKKGEGKNLSIDLGAFDASGEKFLSCIIPHKLKELLEDDPYQLGEVRAFQKEIRACSGFVFLIDAELSIPAIKAKRSREETLPHQLLGHLGDFLRHSMNKRVGKLDVPIAFVINKADVVQNDLPLFKKHMHVRESQKPNEQELNDEAEAFIKKRFPELYKLTENFEDKYKFFHAVSCWGQEPKYYYTERIGSDTKVKEVPGSKRYEDKYKGRLKVKVDTVNPIRIEAPLVDLLKGIEAKVNSEIGDEQYKKLKRTAGLIIFTCLLLFLPWLTFGTGRIMESLTPAWASKMYSESYDWALIKGIVPREKITIRAWGLYNKGKMGKSDLIALLRRAAMPIPMPETIEEIYLEMMAGEVRHAFETKDSEKAISFLREIEEAVPQDYAQPLICEVLDGEAPKFFQTQNIEQKLSFLKDISDITGSCQWTGNANRELLLERVKASLKHGRPKDAIAMIRSQSSHSMPFISYLEHAEKAAVMAYIPGSRGLEPFYIDRYETTNLEYQRFMEEQNGPEPLYWNTQEYRRFSPNNDCPVIFISLEQVRMYAQKQGKRLPFAREWERAWGEQSYPWGSRFDPEKSNTREKGLLKAVSINSDFVKNDKSSHGVFGLAGNVSEYTEDTFPDASTRKRVHVKGGNFLYPANDLNREYADKILIKEAKETIGFRCALNVLPNTAGEK